MTSLLVDEIQDECVFFGGGVLASKHGGGVRVAMSSMSGTPLPASQRRRQGLD